MFQSVLTAVTAVTAVGAAHVELGGARDGDGEERGASLVEYALLISLIALVCLLAVTFFGGSVSHQMSQNASAIP